MCKSKSEILVYKQGQSQDHRKGGGRIPMVDNELGSQSFQREGQ